MLGAKTIHTTQKSTGLKSGSLRISKMAPKLNRKEHIHQGALNKIFWGIYATAHRKDREDCKPEPLCNAYCYWQYITGKEYKCSITLFVTEKCLHVYHQQEIPCILLSNLGKIRNGKFSKTENYY